jgi:hypothetical protein
MRYATTSAKAKLREPKKRKKIFHFGMEVWTV